MLPSPSSGPPLLSASWSPPLSPGGLGGAGGAVARWWVAGGVAGGFGAVEAEWLTGGEVGLAVPPAEWWTVQPAATAASSASPAAHRVGLGGIARPSCWGASPRRGGAAVDRVGFR